MLCNKAELKIYVKLISFLFSFQLKKIFWKYPNFFEENPGTYKNFIAHVLYIMYVLCTSNLKL